MVVIEKAKDIPLSQGKRLFWGQANACLSHIINPSASVAREGLWQDIDTGHEDLYISRSVQQEG